MSSRQSKGQHQSTSLNARLTNENKRRFRIKLASRKRLNVRAPQHSKEQSSIENIEKRLQSTNMDPTQQRCDHPIALLNKRLRECRETSQSVNRSSNSNRSPSPFEGIGSVVSKLFGGSYTDVSQFKDKHKELKMSSGRCAHSPLKQNCRKLKAQFDRSRTESPGPRSPKVQNLVVSTDPHSNVVITTSQEKQRNKTTTGKPSKVGQQKPRQTSAQPIKSNRCSRKVSITKSLSTTDSPQPRAVVSYEELTRTRIKRRRDNSDSPSLKSNGKKEYSSSNAPLTLRDRHARVMHRPPLYQLNTKTSSDIASTNGNGNDGENTRQGKRQGINQPVKDKMKASRKPKHSTTSFAENIPPILKNTPPILKNTPPILKNIPQQRSRSPKQPCAVVSTKLSTPVSNEDSLNPEDDQNQPAPIITETDSPHSPHGVRKSFAVGRRNLSRETISSSHHSSPKIFERVSRAIQSTSYRLYGAKETKQKKEADVLPYRDYGSSTHTRLPRISHPYDELVRRITPRGVRGSGRGVTSEPNTPKESEGPLEDDEENEEINMHGEGRPSSSTITDILKERHQRAMENMARKTELPVLMTSLQRAGHFNWNYDSFARTTYDNDAIRSGRKKGLEQLYYLLARQPPNKLHER